MKNSILPYLLMLGFLFSCKTESDKRSCTPIPNASTITILTPDDSFKFDFEVFENVKEQRFYASSRPIAQNNFDGIKKSLQLDLDKPVIGLILIVSGEYAQRSFSHRDVAAFVTVGIVNNQYHLKGFLIDNQIVIEVPKMDIKTSKLRTSFENLLKKRLQTQNPDNTYQIVALNLALEQQPEILKHLPDEYFKFEKEWKAEAAAKLHGPIGGGYCDAPCNDPINAVCVHGIPDDPNNYWCDEGGGTCVADQVKEALKTTAHNNLSLAAINNVFNANLHYLFRDSFLLNSPTGAAYVSDYYYISSVLNGKSFPPEVLQATFSNLLVVNDMVGRLLNAQQHSNEVLLDMQSAVGLKNLLDQYQLLSNDFGYQMILSILISVQNVFFNR